MVRGLGPDRIQVYAQTVHQLTSERTRPISTQAEVVYVYGCFRLLQLSGSGYLSSALAALFRDALVQQPHC